MSVQAIARPMKTSAGSPQAPICSVYSSQQAANALSAPEAALNTICRTTYVSRTSQQTFPRHSTAARSCRFRSPRKASPPPTTHHMRGAGFSSRSGRMKRPAGSFRKSSTVCCATSASIASPASKFETFSMPTMWRTLSPP